ncbi:MAG TPA: Rossmann-like and DUF2520 domain-containing protein [Candidatus Acidoferrum sp.]|jgi:predicted short-subunit dehydrogenase-like oxidoreductase (DUF2520 family)|nr:Rossmann-like and DUF2520 domain-containing protein [Candidatus Acidoferrum sp.]
MPKTLAILGAGRVGRALGRLLHERGWRILVVAAHSETTARKAAKFIRAGRPLAGISHQALAARIILISVSDDIIPEIAAELARIGGQQLRRKIVLHTSGACDASVLQPVRAFGAFTASMHPMQTFNGVSVPPLEGKIFAIEGDAPAGQVARSITRSLGGVPVNITAEKKPLYHAAGAFAAGLVLALEEAGVQLLKTSGLPQREALHALLSLSRQVLEHYEKLGPHKAWTGPLSRGDYGVVAAHEEAIAHYHPEFLEAYQAVSHLSGHVLAADPAAVLGHLEKLPRHSPLLSKSKGGSA